MIDVKVRFTKKLFSSEEGFSVYSAVPTHEYKKLVELSDYGNFTISGNYVIDESELHKKVFHVSIEEDVRAKYPCSYKMNKIHYTFPEKAEEQWDFIREADLVTGLQYMNLSNHFDEKTDKILDIILDETYRIEDAKGFGEKSAIRLRDKVEADKYKALVYQSFGKIDGIGPSLVRQIIIYSPHVEETIETIKKDPFFLLRFKGVGFNIADNVRAHLGISLEDKERCLHGVKYFITESFRQTGSTYADLNMSIQDVARSLNVNKQILIDYIKEEMDRDEEDKKYNLKFFGHYVTTVDLFKAENIVYRRTQSLKRKEEPIMDPSAWDRNKEKLLSKKFFELSEEQEDFLRKVNEERILLLVGPGGSGKSWVTKLACQLLRKAGKKVGLYAPTARAAKVMADYTGWNASTIHRGLMKFQNGFADEDDEYEGYAPEDVIVLDESSMIDSELMAVVYKAMRPDARIIIIGDDFQLPSVGPGNILYDLIHSLKVPIVNFTKIYRQSETSNIINQASALREGSFYINPAEEINDFGDIVFINNNSEDEIKDLALEYYKGFKDDYAQEDLMFLTPVNKGPSGRRTINKEIQKIVNGDDSKQQLVFGKNSPDESDLYYYRKNDYITISNNNYGAESEEGEIVDLINGDIGSVVAANEEGITVEIDGLTFYFNKDDVMSNVEHLWATTIHKSQGGQAHGVIIVIPPHSWGLSANMLYTAITRAQTKCIIIGNISLLNRAAHKFANFNRKTMIALQSAQA